MNIVTALCQQCFYVYNEDWHIASIKFNQMAKYKYLYLNDRYIPGQNNAVEDTALKIANILETHTISSKAPNIC